MKTDKSVSEYMRREIDSIAIILDAATHEDRPPTLSDIAVDRLKLAAQRLEQSLQYLARGA